MKLLFILLITFFLSKSLASNSTVAPILVIHGISADCDYSITKSMTEYFGTYAQCYPIGEKDPSLFSWIYNIKLQGKILWEKILTDHNLRAGNFSIMAISQGAVIAKYIIENWPLVHPVRSLVTFGGPNMGVSSPPRCPLDTIYGRAASYFSSKLIYWDVAQMFLAPADYWRDPNNFEGYLKHSRFLAEANNEVNFSQKRKDSWLNLKYTIFVKWEEDGVIIPRESSWWGELTSDHTVISRFNSEVYKQDLIGIRTLEESGRADFITIPGDHMHFNPDQINKIVEKAFTR